MQIIFPIFESREGQVRLTVHRSKKVLIYFMMMFIFAVLFGL